MEIYLFAGANVPICRSTRHQLVCYNGHKRVHALEFQSVVVPNWLMANLYGPMGGRMDEDTTVRSSGRAVNQNDTTKATVKQTLKLVHTNGPNTISQRE